MLSISVVLCATGAPAGAQPSPPKSAAARRPRRRRPNPRISCKAKRCRRRRCRSFCRRSRTSRRVTPARRTPPLPNGDWWRHISRSWDQSARCDHDGAAAQYRPRHCRIERSHRELRDRRCQGRVRRSVSCSSRSTQHGVQPAATLFESGPTADRSRRSPTARRPRFRARRRPAAATASAAVRPRSDNDAALNSYNPYYQTAISLNYVQPLLRGAGERQSDPPPAALGERERRKRSRRKS